MTAASIRRLGAGEGDDLRRVNALFGRVFEDPAYSIAPPSLGYLDRLLANDAFIVLTAEIGGEIAGALAAYELPKFEQERSEIYIYDLAVEEWARRQGVATALIEWLKDYASSVGAWMIYVQADPPDAPAVALYEKLGAREEVFHFDISPASGRQAKPV